MLRKNLLVDDVRLLPAGQGFLLCEFGADSPEDADRMANALLDAAKHFDRVPTAALYSPEEAERVWQPCANLAVSVPASSSRASRTAAKVGKIPPFHLELLGAYLRDLFALIDEYGYRTPMYGHFGQGCVHLRITFDFKDNGRCRRNIAASSI